MCAVFGYLDYKGKVSNAILKNLIQNLSIAAEVRGTDATGISYVNHGKVVTFKKAKPAHKMKLYFPKNTRAVIGHTRMTTQGSEKYNYNNHPFDGRCGTETFALAHNGVLFLDEVAEFKGGILDLLRAPLEEHCIRLSRNGRSVVFPANFLLFGAMNERTTKLIQA